MKKITLLCLLLSSLFSKDYLLTQDLINELKEERSFYTICVENYKWVQFVDCKGTIGRANGCKNIGNPIQMFYDAKVDNTFVSRVSVPITCKDK